MNNYINSPIQAINFNGNDLLIKRDDLLNVNFSGNKARKLYYYLINDFANINTIVSYGGNQSNLMYSLSCLAQLKNWDFIYYSKILPKYLKDNPSGNLLHSINNRMQLIELVNFSEVELNKIKNTTTNNQLFINQGAAIKEAEYGLKQLAQELISYIEENNIKKYSVFIPSGTGTSALYLKKYLPNTNVITTNCIGSPDYLTNQFTLLETNTAHHPQILPRDKKYIFGKPHKDLIKIYQELLHQTGIEFDLLYDPIGWITLLRNIKIIPKPIIYIHCGGILGNKSMLNRYNYINM